MSDAGKSTVEHRESVQESGGAVEQVDTKATADVFVTQAEVSGATAEVLEGVEDAEASEGFKEGEKQGKAKKGSGITIMQQDDDQTTAIKAQIHPLPPPPKMKKEVARAIRQEIRKQEREVVFAYVGLRRIAPSKLAEMVARIRQLKDILASIVDATTDALKGLYLKWIRGGSEA